ncbi:MAG: DoxX family protein, partial [Chitinophagaceae bacterium]
MRSFFRTLMALLYVAAGVNHFVHPAMYLAIMPPWLPAHAALVAISGVAEVVLGVLLLVPRTRRAA